MTILLLAACSSNDSEDDSSPPPQPVNAAPVANAGAGQTVNSGVLVTLNGAASSDPDGTVASYAWTQISGPAVTLSSSTVSQPTFTAPTVTSTTSVIFSLTVTDNVGATSPASSVSVTVNPLNLPGTVAGRVRFMRIPVTANGLNYAAGALQPARGVVVQAVHAGSQAILATAGTDANGDYSMSVAGNTTIRLQVVAQLSSWNFRVQDGETAGIQPYVYTDGLTFGSSTGITRNVDIPAGFDGSGNVTGTRDSAPFAILDTVYQGVQTVLNVAPSTNFPALIIDWAPSNPGGETFYSPESPQFISLAGSVTEDTDEFDQHVIAHEFGHYIENNFSRADNIGGPHGLGDKLDIRVAFGEGFGYAFSAIVLNDPLARDSFVDNGAQTAGSFNIETNPSTTPPGTPTGNFGCWCSESSVWSILWDLYDSTDDANDTLTMGFLPLWNVLINQQRTTPAFTSVFSFISALKSANPGQAAAIDTLLAAQNIRSVADAYGTGEINVPSPVPVLAALPLYTNITVGGPPVVLRNVDDAGLYNTLGNHRFLRFTLPTARTITITVSSSNTANADPDFLVYRNGEFVHLGFDPPPQPESETITNAAAGEYLLDVYDCANGCASEEGTPGDYDLTVTVN